LRRVTVVGGVAFSLAILHFLLNVGFGLSSWVPDLLTLGLLILAREVRTGTAAGVGFLFGLLEDAFSILSFGANAVAMTIVGGLGSRSRDLFVGESMFFIVSYLAVGTWLRFALHWLASGGGPRPQAMEALAVHGPLAALYTGLAGVLLLRTTGLWQGDRNR